MRPRGERRDLGAVAPASGRCEIDRRAAVDARRHVRRRSVEGGGREQREAAGRRAAARVREHGAEVLVDEPLAVLDRRHAIGERDDAIAGRRLIDALVDLPFALPTAVAGIALTAIYSANGWIGRVVEPMGFKIAYTPVGIVLALVFIGLPFAVRTVQPILEAMGRESEEAAVSLGASRFTALRRVVFPELLPGLLTGFSLAFARGLGEYGSVIFIAGNLPYKTEIAPLLITIRLEEYDYDGAVAIAALLLAASFLCLLAINAIPALFKHARRRDG